MAGKGVKLFVSGEVAKAVEVNEYLMDQVIARFPTVEARDLAFGDGIPTTVEVSPGVFGSGKPALTEGRFCYIDATNEVQYFNGNIWQASNQFSIEDNAVTENKIAAGSVTETKIGATAVTSNKIDNGAVTSAKLSSSLSLTGTTSLEQILEKATVSGSALSSTTNLDALSGAVYYSTASTTSNITLNLRGDGGTALASLVPSGKAFSCVFMITSGSTNGKILTVTAGSSTVAVKWFGGNISPSGSGSGGIDVYTITAIKTNDAGNGTFTVFISQSKFA